MGDSSTDVDPRADVRAGRTGIPSAVVHALLAAWELGESRVTLAAHRENTVYRVEGARGERFALRVRRAGYRSDPEIDGELDWTAMLAREGLRVPLPIATPAGHRTVCREGHRADLVTWLDGDPLGQSGRPLALADPPATFRALGRAMARLHGLSDAWTPPPGFTRPRWELDELLGDAPLWGRFWDCPGLDTEDRALFTRLREAARLELGSAHDTLDRGLIHADLVRENVLLDPADPTVLSFIDFDDGAVGYRLFDVATALGKNVDEPGYLALRDALLAGYRDTRPLDTARLELFMAVRAATYVGWSVARRHEAGGAERADRAVRTTRRAAERWLRERP